MDSLVLLAQSSAETQSELYQAAFLLRGLNRAGIEAVLADIARHLADPALSDSAFLAQASGTQAQPDEGATEPQGRTPAHAGTRTAEAKPEGWFQRIFFARKAQESAVATTGRGSRAAKGDASSSEIAAAPALPQPAPAASPQAAGVQPASQAASSRAQREVPASVHLPPRHAQSTVVRTPLATARWDSGPRSRLMNSAVAREGTYVPAQDSIAAPAESGIRRAAVVAGVPVGFTSAPPAPASTKPVTPAQPVSPASARRPASGETPLSRPWDLLSRLDARARATSAASARTSGNVL